VTTLTKTKPLCAIGLMSGTSLDGIDIAVLTTNGETVSKFGPTATAPYSRKLREKVRNTLGGIGDTSGAEALVTEAHIVAVRTFLKEHGLNAPEIDLIGFHGHTILHRPLIGKTWQIGDGKRLAQELSIDVVADFREADMEGGGEGAPLAPIFHQSLAHALEHPLCILNIGGVANVTWINQEEMVAFDTGPGNALVDDWMLQHTGQEMDAGGTLAATGKIDEMALKELLSDPYFSRPTPKSLDRDYFSEHAATLLAKKSSADGAATLTAFTARAVRLALQEFPKPPRQFLVCGGGRKNDTLMQILHMELGTQVKSVENVGWRGDAMEAQLFAFLAVRSRYRLPFSFPTTTGVASPRTGGRLFRAAPKTKEAAGQRT